MYLFSCWKHNRNQKALLEFELTSHAVNPNVHFWPFKTKTMSLGGYPKVIPYIMQVRTVWDHSSLRYAADISVNPNPNFDLSTQNHTTCRISQGHSLYQVRTLWNYSFLTYISHTAHVINIGCPSVRPSVCLSVTRWYCFKTAQPILKLSSLPGSPMILVFEDQTFPRNSNGITLNGVVKCKG